MRADPYLTESGQINQINPVQYERLPVVEGHDGSSDRQDPGNVQSPRATLTCSIDPLLHTYPTNQVDLVQIDRHVQVEPAGHAADGRIPQNALGASHVPPLRNR